MIEFYFWPTSNNRKVAIMLEEVGFEYRLMPVDIRRGDQFQAGFVAISPNSKVPAIVDLEPTGGGAPVTVFESGAILFYLARKSGRLMPAELRRHYEVVEWVMWQMGGIGPMAGQAGHFLHHAPEKIPYAIARFTNELARLYRVLDTRLSTREFIADEYSVADIACWPWISNWRRHNQTLDDKPHLKRWLEQVGSRPAVIRGAAVGADLTNLEAPLDDAARAVLFGAKGGGA